MGTHLGFIKALQSGLSGFAYVNDILWGNLYITKITAFGLRKLPQSRNILPYLVEVHCRWEPSVRPFSDAM